MREFPDQIESIDEVVAESLRRKTPAQRVAMCSNYDQMVRQLTAAFLRATYREWNELEIQRGVARTMLGPDLTNQLRCAGYKL
jgi:hypothetical protein